MLPCNETHAGSRLPAVDARLVVPETRYEIVDGGPVHVSPADEAHGTQHSKILGEQDLDRLQRWIARAAVCVDLAEVLGRA